MVIKASTGRQVDALIADLASPSAITRDGAVARLTVIGERAVQDGEILVEIDMAKLQRMYPIIKFVNSVNKQNREKAGS